MVYQDISNEVELNKIGKTKSAAQMMDRFFSFVIDYLVISPFAMFILYFAFNNGFVYAKSNPLAPENDLFYVITGSCYFLLFSLIQTGFVSIWNATPGQHFLKIKLEFGEDSSLNMVRVFFRQLLFWVSFVLLGLPFLSVMTNKRRRTFYDQMADVSVVSTKNEKNILGFENEFRYWRALLATLTLFFAFLFTSFVWSNYEQIVSRAFSFAQMQNRNYFCEDLKGVEMSKRLEIAIGLNLVDQLSDNCLDREADFVLWKQKFSDYSLAYFAKSLTSTDPKREAKYLAQACEGEEINQNDQVSLGCKIAYSFQQNKFDELYADLKGDNFLVDVLKYELAEILNKPETQGDLFAKLEQYHGLKQIKKYQILELLSHDEKILQQTPRMPASVDGEIVQDTALRADRETPDRNEKIIEALGEL